MMRRRLYLAVLTIGLLAGLATVAHLTTANAATQKAGQALEIYPPLINLKGDPGETLKTNISLRDVANSPLIVSNEINDFTADGDSGTPKILLDNKEPSPYSIRDWINPIPKVLLNPKEVHKMKVTIHIPDSAAPGGYFGVVRFTGQAPSVEGTGVGLSASIGSLVFVRVNGQANEKMSTDSFYTSGDGEHKKIFFGKVPVQFVEKLKNEGNLYEQPTGMVTITDMFGHKVASLLINMQKRYVLPGSTRKFTQSLDKSAIGNKMLFGRYTVKMEVTYGANKQRLVESTSFIVIPWRLIGGAIIALIVLYFVLRTLIKRYNRHIINQSRRR